MKKFRIVALALCVISLLSCEEPVIGVGQVVPETRSIEPFSEIKLNSVISATFRQIKSSDVNKVVVTAQENLLPYIKSNVEDGILNLTIEEALQSENDIKVEIYGGAFRSLICEGTGDFDSDGKVDLRKLYLENNGTGDIELVLSAKSIEAELNGSGDITFSGASDYVQLDNNGSGDLNSIKLRTFEADINANGSGDVYVYAKELLEVELNGSGDVLYKGKAKIEKSINGSGSLEESK